MRYRLFAAFIIIVAAMAILFLVYVLTMHPQIRGEPRTEGEPQMDDEDLQISQCYEECFQACLRNPGAMNFSWSEIETFLSSDGGGASYDCTGLVTIPCVCRAL
jgi:hypothetical protein